ncbi:hypothetical protein, partial [Litorihabitans aurantiacus]
MLDVIVASGQPLYPELNVQRLESWMTPHVVWVRDLLSRGGMGSQYLARRDVRGFASDEQKVVKTATGVEVISSGAVTVDFDEQIPIGSLVTVWPG